MIKPIFRILPPEEEELWAHSKVQVTTLNAALVFLSLTSLSIGIILAITTDIHIPYDNFTEANFNITRNRVAPGTKATFHEAVRALEHVGPLRSIYSKHRTIRYQYGSSFWNYCKLVRRPFRPYLPSLLRMMELRVDTQYFLRTAVLIIFMSKVFLCFIHIRRMAIWHPRSRFLFTMSYITPILEFAHLTSAILILCLQQDQDKSLKWMMQALLPLFGISFLIYAITYTLLDVYDGKKKEKYLMHLRIFSFISFTSCIFKVYETHSKFLVWKPCHCFIPVEAALMEYICICSIIVFHLSQFYDYDDLEMFTSSTDLETINYSSEEQFKPAFIHSSSFDESPFADFRPIIKIPI